MSDHIERSVRTVVAEVLRIEPSQVFLTSRLRSELGASRGQRVQILCRLEEVFDIKLGLSRAQAWRHITDLVVSVEFKVREKRELQAVA